MTDQEKYLATKLRVSGVGKIDKLRFEKDLESGSFSFDEEPLPAGQYGEPILFATVIISLVSLSVLAAWLLRTTETNHIIKTIEIEFPDGTKKIETIEMDLSSSTAPEAEVIKEIASLCKFDLELLAGE